MLNFLQKKNDPEKEQELRSLTNEFFTVIEKLYRILNTPLLDYSSLSDEDLNMRFENHISDLKQIIAAVNSAPRFSFCSKLPIMDGVGLLGYYKMKKEVLKFLYSLKNKVYDDYGIHYVTLFISAHIYELCSVQYAIQDRKSSEYAPYYENVDRIKSIYKEAEDAMNNMSNDSFSFNFPCGEVKLSGYSDDDEQLWGYMAGIFNEKCSKLKYESKFKRGLKGLFSSKK